MSTGPGNRETPPDVFDEAPPVWHVISGTDLLAILRRVKEGEDPDMVYMEEYANADHERIDNDG